MKEVEKSPYEMLLSQKKDADRLSLYPSLDYKQLYNAITQIVDVSSSLNTGLQGNLSSELQ